MTSSDLELLQKFAASRDETAFAELVQRHINVVFSAALRQLEGDFQLAEDVTQRVFSDLAIKAPKLTRHTSLVGWLYASTRFCALTLRRAESRRRHREQEAYAMNTVNHTTSDTPDWLRVSRVLDEAMHDLSEADREAVLLRYFQNRSLLEVGASLGVSDNAARMRVDRALEKLRQLLSLRGITSTGAALGLLCVAHAASPVPSGLATKISAVAVAGSAAGIGALAFGTKMVLAFAAIVLLLSVPAASWWKRAHATTPPPFAIAVNNTKKADTLSPASAPQNQPDNFKVKTTNSVTKKDRRDWPAVALLFVDERNNKPIKGVQVVEWGSKSPVISDATGVCRVKYSTNAKGLLLLANREPYADVKITLNNNGNQKIPASLTVPLGPAAWIGGRVIDPDGRPVVGAKVDWNQRDEADADKPSTSQPYVNITVTTDADGKWQVHRIADQLIHRLNGSAKHPDYLTAWTPWDNHTQLEHELRDGTYMFHLASGLSVSGHVKDEKGNPVADAEVFVGEINNSARPKTTSTAEGSFEIKNCKPGPAILSASAPPFTVTTIPIVVSTNATSYELILRAGKTLRLKTTDTAGSPIPNVSVYLNCYDNGSASFLSSKKTVPQSGFSGKTDADGRLVWTNAPEGELNFDLWESNHMRLNRVVISQDGEEHIVVMSPPQTISGHAREEDTGRDLKAYRIVSGSPQTNYPANTVTGWWSRNSGDINYFTHSDYRITFTDSAYYGEPERGRMLKFEAEGYEPFVSRIIGAEENDVQIDVTLKPAPTTLVTVLSPQGQPVTGTEVVFDQAGSHLEITPGGLNTRSVSPGAIARTDAKGQFKLPADKMIRNVIAATPEGFAEFTPAQLKQDPTMALQPWARLQVTCQSNGQPAKDRSYILAWSTDSSSQEIIFDNTAYKFSSDENGRFVVPMVPPGKHPLIKIVVTSRGDRGSYSTYGEQTEVELAPGETKELTLNCDGAVLKGALAWPQGIDPAQWIVTVSVATPWTMPPPTAEERKDPILLKQYQDRPDMVAARKAVRRYPAVIEGRKFTIQDVPSGQYELMAFAHKPPQKKGEAAQVVSGKITITVPENAGSDPLDIGVCPLLAPPGQ